MPSARCHSAAHAVLDRSRVLVFAHRGGSALRPENTLAAFDHGLSLGADGFELDVHLARDGQVVVHHDAALERTTNGSGPLADFTADELARLDAGYHFRGADGFPYRGLGYAIPRLRDVLARYPRVPIIIELKGASPGLARAAVAVVREAGALDRVCFGGFADVTVRAARSCGDDVVTSAATGEIRWALYRSWVGLGPRRPAYRALQVPERSGATTVVSPRFLRAMQRAGLPVHVWIVNDAADMRRLLGWGVNALITDRPDVAVPLVRAWNRGK